MQNTFTKFCNIFKETDIAAEKLYYANSTVF